MDFYTEHAEELAKKYEAVASDNIHQGWLDLVLPGQSRVLDVGAGTGRDAAWFAAHNHAVVAVEPSEGMRRVGQARHRSWAIKWVDDSLPELSRVYELGLKFELVLLCAVWQDIVPELRPRAFERLVGLMAPGGIFVMNLRHGPSPDQRVMYPAPPEEVIDLANKSGLEVVLTQDRSDVHGTKDVSWTTVVLRLK